MWKEGWLIQINPFHQVKVLRKAARCRAKYWHCVIMFSYYIHGTFCSGNILFHIRRKALIKLKSAVAVEQWVICSIEIQSFFLPASIWIANCTGHGQGYLYELQCTQRHFIVTCFDTGALGAYEKFRPHAVRILRQQCLCLCLLKSCPSLSPDLFILSWYVCALVCASKPNMNVTWHARGVTFFYDLTHNTDLLYTCSHVPAVCPSTTVAFLNIYLTFNVCIIMTHLLMVM